MWGGGGQPPWAVHLEQWPDHQDAFDQKYSIKFEFVETLIRVVLCQESLRRFFFLETDGFEVLMTDLLSVGIVTCKLTQK